LFEFLKESFFMRLSFFSGYNDERRITRQVSPANFENKE